jgi:serine/threonine protein kinase
VSQFAAGLEYIHSLDIIHADLKSVRIFLIIIFLKLIH